MRPPKRPPKGKPLPVTVGDLVKAMPSQSEMTKVAKYLASLNIPEPTVAVPRLVDPNLASEFYERLGKWIGDFDVSLDADHEVGVRLVSFGQSFTFHLESMGYWNPSLISFRGLSEDGNPVELIQHVSQISVLLLKMPRADPSSPKKPFGFSPSEEAGDGST